ncbi:MAG: ATP synthase F1 subunit epsilon [Candidatus Eremiobacteraeota bacterium]|nr:ATP synthase F1 subunit epsilon [Candidatus Eremiobacteraeota bacterium]MBV8366744.1 ATP synthase F1 subunit epsilon [Candidatus Eremiobacteraeota bacterium]
MTSTTRLSVVTPEGTKFEGDVAIVIAPGAAGDLAALPSHAPLLTTLRPGLVIARPAQAPERADADALAAGTRFAVDGGFMQVMPDRVIVLSDRAIGADEVEYETARSAYQRALEALAAKKGADDSAERIAVAFFEATLKLTGRSAE